MSASTQYGFRGAPSRAASVYRLGVPALGRVALLPFWFDPDGLAVGVGQRRIAVGRHTVPLAWCPLTVGVGHDEEPLSEVRGPEVRRADAGRFHLVTEFDEPGDNAVQAPPNESRDVFDDDRERLHLVDDAFELVPEAGALAAEPCAASGERHILAREPAADEVHGNEV